MSALDELREMFARDRFKAGSGTAELLQYDTALADLADLEKAHPGLVDETFTCAKCKKTSGGYAIWHATLGDICPTRAKEAR